MIYCGIYSQVNEISHDTINKPSKFLSTVRGLFTHEDLDIVSV